MTFLSTPSARRATRRSATSSRSLTHFYPRPPRGGRPPLCSGLECLYQFLSTPSARRATDAGGRRPGRGDISIHALREEGDRPQQTSHGRRRQFLSTPSARRATRFYRGYYFCPGISIHALREEGDSISRPTTTSALNFYPRPPRGGRRVAKNQKYITQKFLSTPSARRATTSYNRLSAA